MFWKWRRHVEHDVSRLIEHSARLHGIVSAQYLIISEPEARKLALIEKLKDFAGRGSNVDPPFEEPELRKIYQDSFSGMLTTFIKAAEVDFDDNN
jgi:hypothetical protein